MGNSLIDLSNISAPATELVRKIASAIGIAYEPTRVRRLAKAEKDAALIQAQSEIDVGDLRARADRRRRDEDIREQRCIEAIAAQAVDQIDAGATPTEIEDDWIAHFFDKCRLVSDKEMQSLWARLLAGEAKTPGAYSRKTLNVVGDLEKTDARLFTDFCGFLWMFGNLTPLIFEFEESIYNTAGVEFSSMEHLEALGLISLEPLTGYVKELKNIRGAFAVHYFGKPLLLNLDATKKINVGYASLTRVGQQLAGVSGCSAVPGFYEYVRGRWSKYIVKA